jgi:hypothetical protein
MISQAMQTNLNETKTTQKSSLYEEDFYLWIQTMAQSLREHRFYELDLENLIEEIETMGPSEKKCFKK